MNHPNDGINAPLHMTSETIGRDLLSALIDEIKLLPDVWPKLSQAKQDNVIDRLRKRVETNVHMAVHTIASEGRTVVPGDLEQITIKGGAKAVITFSKAAAGLTELCKASGEAVLIVIAGSEQYTGGMDEIHGEPDQHTMDWGYKHTTADKSTEDNTQDDINVIEGEIVASDQKALGGEAYGNHRDDLGGETK